MELRGLGIGACALLVSTMLVGETVTATPAHAVTSLCSTAIGGGPINDAGDFNLAVAEVNAGDCNVIDIATGFTFTTAPSRIDPPAGVDSLSISGPASGATLNGNNGSGIRINFEGSARELIVEDVTFTGFNGNAFAAVGQAALEAHSYGSPTPSLTSRFTDVNFTSNAGAVAGGLNIQGSGPVTVTMTGTVNFTSNSALYGPGALSVTNDDQTSSLTLGTSGGSDVITFASNSSPAASGGIRANSLTIWGGTFTNNSTSVTGGALSASGDVVLNDVDFTGNSASGDEGGAVHSEGSLTVHGGTFHANEADGSNGFGGAISGWGSISVDTAAVFTDNVATGRGGAINALGPVSATDSTFDGNSSSGGSTTGGGAIYTGVNSAWTVTVDNSTFTDNAVPAGAGGAILSNAAVFSTDSTFNNNTSRDGGGAVSAQSVQSSRDSFSNNNVSLYDGGAISAVESATTTRSTFTGNSVARNGGAIVAARVIDQGSVFSTNFASDNGGAIYFGAGPSTFTGTRFESNGFRSSPAGTTNQGGAISSQGPLTLTGPSTSTPPQACSFTNNKSGTNGGAIRSSGTTSISNCAFTGNVADDIGGAVFVFGGAWSTEINNSTFTNNDANGLTPDTEGNGGAVAVDGPLSIGGSQFTGNSASDEGGAVSAGTTLTVQDSDFSSNSANAGKGGAVFVAGASAIIEESNFIGNDSYREGGAIFAQEIIDITDSTFTSNETTAAGRNGGAVAALGNVTITSSTFTLNSATQWGGAVYTDASATVTESTFDTNDAPSSGGSLSVNGTATVVGSTFTNNTSDQLGGAMTARNLVMRSSSLTDNDAGFNGGAIFILNSADVTNSSFVGNYGGYGGALSFAGSTTLSRISFSTFVNNSAPVGPGVRQATAINAPPSTPIALTGSVLAGASPLCWQEDDPGNSTLDLRSDSAYSFATDTSCSGGVARSASTRISTSYTTATELGFTAPITTDPDPGMQVLIPDANAVVNTYVPLATLPSVTTDQLAGLRNSPNGFTSAGAVQVRPISVSSPANATVTPGSNATFSVIGYPSIGPTMTYQWQRSTDATTWSNITGNASAQTATLTLPSVAVSDSGLLVRVLVTDAYSRNDTSTSATLTVSEWSPAPEPTPTPTPTTTSTPSPTPTAAPIPAPIRPGGALLQVDGREVPVDVQRLPGDSGLRVRGEGWDMTLDGLNRNGKPLGTNPRGALIIDTGSGVGMGGSGFEPGSTIEFFLDPPVAQSTSVQLRSTSPASTAMNLGAIAVDATGRFSAVVDVPGTVAPGPHVLQAVGVGTSGERRVLSLGVVVEAWIDLKRGKRTTSGHIDTVRASGVTGGLPEGTKLTLWLRSSGQETFRRSGAKIIVRADGRFQWTRKVQDSRGLTAYVSYAKTDSNRIQWARFQ